MDIVIKKNSRLFYLFYWGNVWGFIFIDLVGMSHISINKAYPGKGTGRVFTRSSFYSSNNFILHFKTTCQPT